jgi:hypothetical protein
MPGSPNGLFQCHLSRNNFLNAKYARFCGTEKWYSFLRPENGFLRSFQRLSTTSNDSSNIECTRDGFEKLWGNTLVISLWPTQFVERQSSCNWRNRYQCKRHAEIGRQKRDGKFIPPKATMRIKEQGRILKLQSSNKFLCIEVDYWTGEY